MVLRFTDPVWGFCYLYRIMDQKNILYDCKHFNTNRSLHTSQDVQKYLSCLEYKLHFHVNYISGHIFNYIYQTTLLKWVHCLFVFLKKELHRNHPGWQVLFFPYKIIIDLTVIGDTTKKNEYGLPGHQAWSQQWKPIHTKGEHITSLTVLTGEK